MSKLSQDNLIDAAIKLIDAATQEQVAHAANTAADSDITSGALRFRYLWVLLMRCDRDVYTDLDASKMPNVVVRLDRTTPAYQHYEAFRLIDLAQEDTNV